MHLSFSEPGSPMPKQWIQQAVPASHEGRLARYLKSHHTTATRALHSKNAHVRHMAQFAKNMRALAARRKR